MTKIELYDNDYLEVMRDIPNFSNESRDFVLQLEEDGFSESRNEIDVYLRPVLRRPEVQGATYSTYQAALEAKRDELARYPGYTVIFIDEISGNTEEIEV